MNNVMANYIKVLKLDHYIWFLGISMSVYLVQN